MTDDITKVAFPIDPNVKHDEFGIPINNRQYSEDDIAAHYAKIRQYTASFKSAGLYGIEMDWRIAGNIITQLVAELKIAREVLQHVVKPDL